VSGPDIAFITVELFYAVLAIIAAKIFWAEMRWLSYLWIIIIPLPFIMLYVGLVK